MKKNYPLLIFRIFLIFVTALFLFGSCALFFSGASRNIGNLTGIILSVLVILYMLFMPKIHKKISGILSQGGKGKVSLLAVFALALLIFLVAMTETIFMAMYSNRKAPSSERPPVVIVLGCQVRNGRPSMLLSERIDTAYSYLSDHPECVCIVSGGKGTDETISEAKCMYDELVKMGISSDRIYMEDRSTSTRENLAFSKEIMERENLGDTAILITNSWHELRAQMIASELHIPCGAKGAASPWWLLPSFYLRELYGILYQIFL